MAPNRGMSSVPRPRIPPQKLGEVLARRPQAAFLQAASFVVEHAGVHHAV